MYPECNEDISHNIDEHEMFFMIFLSCMFYDVLEFHSWNKCRTKLKRMLHFTEDILFKYLRLILTYLYNDYCFQT